MKKGVSQTEKLTEQKVAKKPNQVIKFILNEEELACFKSQRQQEAIQQELETTRDAKTMVIQKLQPSPAKLFPYSFTEPVRQRPRISSFKNNFNEKVVIMHYDDIDVYVDNSTKKKASKSRSRSPSAKRKFQELEPEDQFVSSCVRVITQETDITSSNGFSHISPINYCNVSPIRQYLYPNQQLESNQYYYPRNKTTNRKGRSVTVEESRALSISYSMIEIDGRTTIMVKNIPNKYTQDMLLEEFSIRCPANMEKYVYDFFYLPIDKNNQCNMGYAFVNFINPTHIKQFYLEFHQKKWKKYKSPKTCELSYAVCQGTLQLANHFKHTKTLQQKDKRLRPLIGANLICRIKQLKEIEEIVKSQRTKQ